MAPNKRLKKWIAREGISNAEAARRVGYDRSNFHRIIEGQAKPTIDLAHRIAETTGDAVPLACWIGFEPVAPISRKPSAAPSDRVAA